MAQPVDLTQIQIVGTNTATGETLQDAPTRTLQQTQSTSSQTPIGAIPYEPPSTINAADPNGYDSVDSATFIPQPSPTADNTLGAGAANDDNPFANPTSTQFDAALDIASNNNSIAPSPNVLDQFASYTYSLSWYALTPSQYQSMVDTSKINPAGWSLLMQSGGAAIGGNRNKFFQLDYYMDNLEIETTFTDSGPSAASNISFTVTEPNGMTLLRNLNNALRDLLQVPTGSLAAAAPMAQYVMVIRFYGYDQFGNLATNVTQVPGTPGVPTHSNAVVVKYFPFSISTFTFQAANKSVEYMIKGTCPQYKYNKGSALGSVPNTIELTGETVDDILNGKAIKNPKAAETNNRDQPAPAMPSTPYRASNSTTAINQETGQTDWTAIGN